MIILSGGMRRSGSTLLFNCIRLILEESSAHYEISEPLQDIHPSDIAEPKEGSHLVIHTHNLWGRRGNAEKLVQFTCLRDAHEVAGSMRRLFSAPDAEIIRNLSDIIKNCELIVESPGNYSVFTYRNLTSNLSEVLVRIANKLSLNVDDVTIKRIVFQLEEAKKKNELTRKHKYGVVERKIRKLFGGIRYDQSEFRLHRGHVSGNQDYSDFEPAPRLAEAISRTNGAISAALDCAV
jgi:hypothetical protein